MMNKNGERESAFMDPGLVRRLPSGRVRGWGPVSACVRGRAWLLLAGRAVTRPLSLWSASLPMGRESGSPSLQAHRSFPRPSCRPRFRYYTGFLEYRLYGWRFSGGGRSRPRRCYRRPVIRRRIRCTERGTWAAERTWACESSVVHPRSAWFHRYPLIIPPVAPAAFRRCERGRPSSGCLAARPWAVGPCGPRRCCCWVPCQCRE